MVTTLRAKGAKSKGSKSKDNTSNTSQGASHASTFQTSKTVTSSTTTTRTSTPPPQAQTLTKVPKLNSAVYRYAAWLEENQLKKTGAWIAVGVAVLVRWAVSLGPYSGFATPPRFGDYEAQRHWMELTLHRPIREWGNLINTDWFAWKESRGFESDDAKLYMRATVLVLEILIYFSAVLVFTQRWFANKAWTRKHTALLLILLQPGLILIDNGHFQYNAVMLGLVLWAINSFLDDQDVLGSIFFCLALGFKQMALYFSPAVFGYLLGKSLRQGFFGCIWKLIKLGTTVIATLGLMFSPWLQSQEEILQVVHRIFPVFRGLYQDKVANIWCAVNVVIKLREMFDIQELVRFSTVATLVSFLPSVLYLIAKPTKRGLIYGLINSSLSFFLLSFQVHEKSILIPALPITLLILDEPAIASLFVTLATFSMFPLLRQEELTLPYYVLLAFWAWMTSSSLSSAPRFLQFVAVINLLFITAMHIAEIAVPTPLPRYPDLYPVLNALWSAAGFVLFWLYFNYRQFATVHAPNMGLRVTKRRE
ncbi:Glucosyltransferase-like protein [Haplosporangium bisporale]|nr:Glucosyltransferase-like protein [Haplosporangium bisporale]